MNNIPNRESMRRLKRALFLVLLAGWPLASGGAPAGTAGPSFDRFTGIPGVVNTAGVEFGPSFTRDGRFMVFSAGRGRRYQDLYSAELIDGRWQKVRALTLLNSPFNDETASLSPDGNLIFFASDRDGSMELPKDEHGRIRVSYDLYWSRRTAQGWTRPSRLPGSVNTPHHERTPSFDAANKILYYSSWHFGSLAQARIMRADLVNGAFVNARPLPPHVNLGFRETAPVVSLFQSGLVFSSQRPGGFGGFDLYFTSYENGVYGNPVNLGAEVNSPHNEFFFSRIGTSLYFCSDRPGGRGRYDILARGIPSKKTLVLRTIDAETKKPIASRVIVSGQLPAGPPFETEHRSDPQGRIETSVESGATRLALRAESPGYLPLATPASGRAPEQVLKLVPVKKDGSFEIRAVRFDFDSARIKPNSFPYLDALALYLSRNPGDRYEIVGHTDLHGSADLNLKLSRKRAQAVRAYLIKRGLPKGRFDVAGAGMSRPIVEKKGAPHDAINRRTEFRRLVRKP